MAIELTFYDLQKLLDFKNWLDKNKLVYDYYDEEEKKYWLHDENSIRVFDLNEYDNDYRSLSFYIEFYNKNDELCYKDLRENEIARWKITLA